MHDSDTSEKPGKLRIYYGRPRPTSSTHVLDPRPRSTSSIHVVDSLSVIDLAAHWQKIISFPFSVNQFCYHCLSFRTDTS